MDVPQPIQLFLRSTASLGSVTDTLNYKWACAYVNEFPVTVERLELDKMRITAQGAVGFCEEA
jgi:hypothetical protein